MSKGTTWSVDDIIERVNRVEDKRAPYRSAALKWEKMWALQPFSSAERARSKAMDREEVVLPTPYNVVHLARRLLSNEPKIEIPGQQGLGDDDSARLRQRWLSAFWQRSNHQQRRDIIEDAKFHILVRGRCAFQVLWVEDVLPERLKGSRLPILLRTLDPLTVGVSQGPLYAEYAYHKDTTTRGAVRQQYPDYEGKSGGRAGRWDDEDEEVEVIDFWWLNQDDGAIWNAVIVDDEFVKKPVATDYPDIPIVEGYGDSAPIASEEYRSLSILHPIRDVWPYACRLASLVGTGLLFYFWPSITVVNEMGMEVPDLEFRPGTTTTLPAGTKVDLLRGDVNVPLAERMMSQMQSQLDFSTFPGVMYGQQPGDLQAGYGVSILADQARGRMIQFRQGLETAIEHVNELILGLVEKMAPPAGVTVWGKNSVDGRMFSETLTPGDIDGDYANLVSLAPTMSNDDAQRQTLGLRMVEAGIISKKTFRDKFMSIPFPDDEKLRIDTEQAEASGELAPAVMLRALMESYPNDWQELIRGTPVEEVARKTGVLPAGGAPPMPPGAPPMPPGMQPPMSPEMMGILPGMEQQMPGVYQEMMGQPLPPDEELMRLAGIPPQMR